MKAFSTTHIMEGKEMDFRSERVMNGNGHHLPQNHPFYHQHAGQPVNQVTPFQYYQKPAIPYTQDNHMNKEPISFKKQHPPLLQYFQTEDGDMDIEKVMYMVNQLASTYHQVSPIVKNVGSLLKNFRDE